jgi:hypothetical protein
VRPAAPVAALVAAIALLLMAEALAIPGSWLPLDEAGTAVRARDSTAADHVSGPLTPALLAPAAGALAADAFLWLGRSLSMLCWAALAVPAYLLARPRAGRRQSLVAAALAALVPASLLGTALTPDAPALLLAGCSLALAARGHPLAAVATAVAAAFARPWLAPLAPAVALALVLPRLRPADLLRWPRSLAPVAAFAVAYALVYGLDDVSPELARATEHPSDVLRAALASLAAAAVGTGVLPWLAAWAQAGRARADARVALLVTCAPALALAAGFSAATGDTGVDERPLVALAPLVLALAAGAWARRELPRGPLLAAAAATAACALALPARPSLDSAPGLAWLAPSGGSRATLVVTVLALVTLAGALPLVLRRRPPLVLAAVAALLAVGQLGAWADARAAGRGLAGGGSWIDDAVGADARVATLAPLSAEPDVRLAAAALWNRSLVGRAVVDPAAADPRTGLLATNAGPSLVLAAGFEPAGELVAARDGLRLIRAQLPLRRAEVVEGLYTDGWSGALAVYRRFSGEGAGIVKVEASRRDYSGHGPPGTVSVAAGPLDGEPAAGTSVVLRSRETHVLHVDVPAPPFQVVVTVAPTFSPGGEDVRQLGAQLRFAYRPG